MVLLELRKKSASRTECWVSEKDDLRSEKVYCYVAQTNGDGSIFLETAQPVDILGLVHVASHMVSNELVRNEYTAKAGDWEYVYV